MNPPLFSCKHWIPTLKIPYIICRIEETPESVPYGRLFAPDYRMMYWSTDLKQLKELKKIVNHYNSYEWAISNKETADHLYYLEKDIERYVKDTNIFLDKHVSNYMYNYSFVY